MSDAKNVAMEFAEAGERFKLAAEAGRFPVEPPEHPAKSHARWALELYRECQRDAEADPWWEPGGAERRFIARLREYAGERVSAEKAARRRFGP